MANNIIAEEQVQVLVEDIITLFTSAQKIDEIRAVVQDLRCHIIPGKVIFQGILHKQIFFVNEDNGVVHQGVDIPFAGFVEIEAAEPGQFCQLAPVVEFIDFELLSPTTMREVTVIRMNVRLLEMPLPAMPVINGAGRRRSFKGNQAQYIVKNG